MMAICSILEGHTPTELDSFAAGEKTLSGFAYSYNDDIIMLGLLDTYYE